MIFAFLFFLSAGLFPHYMEAGTVIHQDKVPDLIFALDPYRVSDDQAVSGLVQIGLRDWRFNGTYAFSINDQHLFKVSAEYLREKLGFSFEANRLHAWVQQFAVGAEYRLYSPLNCIDFLDVGLNYSHSPSRELHLKLVPDNNLLNERRIAGADAVSAQAQTFWTVGRGAIGTALFYDFVLYRRKFQHQKIVTGPGIGFNCHYPVCSGIRLHLNAELRRPYLFLEARLGCNSYFGRTSMGSSVFVESVRGFQSLPSSTRFGIELAFNFKSPNPSNCAEEDYPCPTAAQLFARSPAVYRPQVLAISDQRTFGFLEILSQVQSLSTLTFPVGTVSFDASSYFTGSGPFVYVGSNFPPGLAIDPLTGLIEGIVSSDAVGTYSAEIVVMNSTGRIVQPVIMHIVP